MQGKRISMDVNQETLVETIRDESKKKLFSTGSPDLTYNYTLVCATGPCKRLENKSTVKLENLKPGDYLLLYKMQWEHLKTHEQPMSRSIPTLQSIKKATEGLPTLDKPPSSTILSPGQTTNTSTSNLEQTFRKILLTLLDLSYKLMFFDDDAEGLFNNERKKRGANAVNPALMSQLTEMGFSEVLSAKALKICHMDVEAAMEWLLRNQDADVDMEEARVADESDESDEDVEAGASTTACIKRRLLQWKKKTLRSKPNTEHVSFLVGMGFSKEESIQSLRIFGNNPNAACDWLLSEDRKMPDHDPDDSLPPDSELHRAIVNNPTIHIGLHNRRVLEALEDMLDNPMRRHNWANDPTVGSVILQILKLYHKYSTSG